MNIMEMMKQMKDLQARGQAMQEELAAARITGTSGGGLVTVILNGKFDMISVTLDPTLLKPDEGEIVADLVLAAFNDAKAKAERVAQEKMQSAMGGLSLPAGFKPF